MNKNPFNFRTIFTGIILGILLVFISQYSVNVLLGDTMAEDHLPVGGIFIFFILCLFLNPILKILTRRRFFFSSAELLVVYIMLLTTAPVAELLGCVLFPTLAGIVYYASPQNGLLEIIPRIKNWLIPKNFEVVRGFFEGADSVPWLYWIKIFLPWFFFVLGLYFTSICIVSLLRKQWVERERLSFPLNNLALAMTEKSGKNLVNSFFKNKSMWIGFTFAFLLASSAGLSQYFHFLPSIKLFQMYPIFRGTTKLPIAISLPIIGIMYFVNASLSFSLWFFALFFKFLEGYFNTVGISCPDKILYSGVMGGSIFAHIGFGALLVYAGSSLWVARAHLAAVFKKAIGRDNKIEDKEEILSYRASFWGLILGLLFMTLWLKAAGMSVAVAFFFILLTFIILIGLAKAIAQGGLITLKVPSLPSSQVRSIIGSQTLGQQNIINLGLSTVYSPDAFRNFPLSAMFHGAKLGEKIRKNIRPLFWIMMLSLIVGMISSNFLLLKLAYKYGGLNMWPWYFNGYPITVSRFISSYITHPEKIIFSGYLYKAIGILVMLFLTLLHLNFLWWPIHPLGFAVSTTFRVTYPWLSIFIGWLLNFFILRYGGPKIYGKCKPFFLGLILGTFVAVGVWFVINSITGTMGVRVFYM